MLLHMQRYDYTIQYWQRNGVRQLLKSLHLPVTPSPFASHKMSSMYSYPVLNWTSFEVPWNVAQCIAPSITWPLEVGPSTGSKSQDCQTLLRSPGLTVCWCWPTPQGTRVCIPPELLDHTLADLHGAHQGINGMQAQAREAVYWPDIDMDITNYVCPCTICTKHKASPLHSQCSLEKSPMVHGRRSLLITSPTGEESTYWYAICLASTLPI